MRCDSCMHEWHCSCFLCRFSNCGNADKTRPLFFAAKPLPLQGAIMELGKALPERRRPLPLDLVRMGDNTTLVLPRGFITGGSTTSEAACAGVRKACQVGFRPCREHMGMGHLALEAACAGVWKLLQA
jgi:hypothetical protein